MPNRFEQVIELLEVELAKPYEYGHSDCFFMACRVVDGLSGSNHAEAYASRYTTLAGAQKALRKEGHKSLVSFWAGHLEQIAPMQARYGDLAVLDLGGEEHMAVCTGQFVTKTEKGAQTYPVSLVKAAFRVD